MSCTDPCSNKSSSDDISYVGPNLPGSGVQTCDSLTLAIQKLDNKLIVLQNEIYRTTTTTTSSTSTSTTTTTTAPPTTTTTSTSSTTTTTSSTTTTSTSSTTTTTTTVAPVTCKTFTIQSTQNSASWLALDCDDNIVGGLILLSGTTVSTGCIWNNSLELYDMTIISQVNCP